MLQISYVHEHQEMAEQLSTRLDYVGNTEKVMTDAFNIAAYLVNIAWIIDIKQLDAKPSLAVFDDQDTGSKEPSASLAGAILVSILIIFRLLGLFMTATHASCFPRWTNALNAFSLLRLGNPNGKNPPLRVSQNDDEIEPWKSWMRCLFRLVTEDMSPK